LFTEPVQGPAGLAVGLAGGVTVTPDGEFGLLALLAGAGQGPAVIRQQPTLLLDRCPQFLDLMVQTGQRILVGLQPGAGCGRVGRRGRRLLLAVPGSIRYRICCPADRP
jgi:hypothetical protein